MDTASRRHALASVSTNSPSRKPHLLATTKRKHASPSKKQNSISNFDSAALSLAMNAVDLRESKSRSASPTKSSSSRHLLAGGLMGKQDIVIDDFNLDLTGPIESLTGNLSRKTPSKSRSKSVGPFHYDMQIMTDSVQDGSVHSIQADLGLW